MAVPTGLGECPSTLTGLGRDLWLDAAAHLAATGQAAKVYRHPLSMICHVYEEAMASEEMGINRLEACRRWLHELGLTPATAVVGASQTVDEDSPAQTGRTRLLKLLER